MLGSVSIGYTAESSRLESGAWWWHCAYPLTLKHGPPLTMGGAGTPAYVAVKGETSLAREPSALQVSVRVFWPGAAGHGMRPMFWFCPFPTRA